MGTTFSVRIDLDEGWEPVGGLVRLAEAVEASGVASGEYSHVSVDHHWLDPEPYPYRSPRERRLARQRGDPRRREVLSLDEVRDVLERQAPGMATVSVDTGARNWYQEQRGAPLEEGYGHMGLTTRSRGGFGWSYPLYSYDAALDFAWARRFTADTDAVMTGNAATILLLIDSVVTQLGPRRVAVHDDASLMLPQNAYLTWLRDPADFLGELAVIATTWTHGWPEVNVAPAGERPCSEVFDHRIREYRDWWRHSLPRIGGVTVETVEAVLASGRHGTVPMGPGVAVLAPSYTFDEVTSSFYLDLLDWGERHAPPEPGTTSPDS
jgi:hypothetical protein